MAILEFINKYWAMILFFIGEVGVLWGFVKSIIKALKCSLRNDIVNIYDRCKEKQEITFYELQCIKYSYDIYKKFKGNSFVQEIVEERLPKFKVID